MCDTRLEKVLFASMAFAMTSMGIMALTFSYMMITGQVTN